MAEEVVGRRYEIELYMSHADEMLQVAEHNLAEGFYSTAVNRAYYAVFYAANALLATQGLSRGKHSGVVAAFRQHFVKPGLIEAEYGRIYGQLMDDRRVGAITISKPSLNQSGPLRTLNTRISL